MLTYEGRGYNNGKLTTGEGAPLSASLSAEFLVLMVVLAAFSIVLRHGRQWFLPALLASPRSSPRRARSPVIFDAIILIALCCHAGIRPSGRQVRAAGALAGVAFQAITGVRAEHAGRSSSRTSGWARGWRRWEAA